MSTAFSKFIEELERPRAAFAYGIDTRELRHNAFLNFMLQPPVHAGFSKRLIREIARHVRDTRRPTEDTSVWDSLSSVEIENIGTECNASVGRGNRPDEVVRCTMQGDKEAVLVFEMKVKSEGGSKQLAEYLRHHVPDGTGLLLRIPGRDARRDELFPVVTGRDYRKCIEKALSSNLLGQSHSQWLVQDYIETLDFLDTMDAAIVECADELMGKSNSDEYTTLNAWMKDNWRWVAERVAREVASQWNHKTSPTWEAGAYSSKDGAAVDFEHEDLVVGSDDNGAGLYLHWKIGSAFEVRAIVNNYHNSPTPQSRETMNQLRDKARTTLKERWQNHPELAFPNRSGNSCCVAKLSNQSYSPALIVRKLKQLVAEVEPLLASAVAEMKRTLDA